jgi:hypothetical protein
MAEADSELAPFAHGWRRRPTSSRVARPSIGCCASGGRFRRRVRMIHAGSVSRSTSRNPRPADACSLDTGPGGAGVGRDPGERVKAALIARRRALRSPRRSRCSSASPDRRAVSGTRDAAAMCSPTWPTNVSARSKARSSATRSGGSVECLSTAIRSHGVARARLPHACPLHAVNGRLGFYREESHELCDASADGAAPRIDERVDRGRTREAARDIAGAAWLPSRSPRTSPATSGACHLELREGADPSAYASLANGLGRLTAQRRTGSRPRR